MSCWKLTKRRKEEENIDTVFPFMHSFPSSSPSPSPFLPFGLYLVYKQLLLRTLLRTLKLFLYLAWHITTFQQKRLQNLQETEGVLGLPLRLKFWPLLLYYVICEYLYLMSRQLMFGSDLRGSCRGCYVGLFSGCEKGTSDCSKVCSGEERSLVPYRWHKKLLLPGNLTSLLNYKLKYKKSQLNTLEQFSAVAPSQNSSNWKEA